MTTVSLGAAATGPRIRPEIYGHFAEHLGRCIYEGLWVGEGSPIPNRKGLRVDVVEALKALEIPVLRWPGGCFADEYHWRDGIGPRETRPAMINTHWGKVVESNHFGTHEFFELVEQLGTKAYVCGNVGSGTPQEMMEWVEYMTTPAESPLGRLRRENGRAEPWKLDYFGVGNESWGCGGHMRPEYYADLYRRYNTFVKNYGDYHVQRIAGGANSVDYRWTEVLMDRAARFMDALSLHYYTIPTEQWAKKGSATQFGTDEYLATLVQTMRMEGLLQQHGEIMDRFDPERRVGLAVDEWGVWTDVEPGTNPGFLYQQNSLRDALLAGLNFHLFHRFADRVSMANIAQTVNVLQAMILTDGPRMLRTPTYWVFEMFKSHQGGTVCPVALSPVAELPGAPGVPLVSASASHRANEGVTLSLVHTGLETAQAVSVGRANWPVGRVGARVLTGAAPSVHNTFEAPDAVHPQPLPVRVGGGQLHLTLPPLSIAVVQILPA